LQPVQYYLKLPGDVSERLCILVDPMLATGNSAAAAATRLKEAGVRQMKFVCLLAAPEGIEAFGKAHPDVPIYTGAVDRQLDGNGYIRPGLGDAGDRFYGTR
jgi:uracil phosphoribosyltransferase